MAGAALSPTVFTSAPKAKARKGIVISDLHLLAPYSNGDKHFNRISSALKGADLCILNGDLFECWNLFPSVSIADVRTHAKSWLSELLHENPNCEFHYLLGNHERIHEFSELLRELVQQYSGRFYLHEEDALRIGSALFVHGDRQVDNANIQMPIPYVPAESKRNAWPKFAAKALGKVAVAGAFARILYPLEKTLERLDSWINEHCEHAHEITHVFFGHIHQAFTAPFKGRIYYNTGATIRGRDLFNPLAFDIAPDGKVNHVCGMEKAGMSIT